MKLVVTGGRGYIGSKIVSNLEKSGHEIIILDNLSTPVESTFSECKFFKTDITRYEDLSKIKLKNVDAVLHLAAQSSGPKSIEIPETDININIIGTLNIIKWCSANEIPRILFASSFVVYGDHEIDVAYNEKMECKPKSIYALSKRYSERMLDIYAEHHQISWNVLRQFNVYGPGQDLKRLDQGMVSIFMNIVMNEESVKVNGSLNRYRDFIHIDDVVSGWELCLKHGKKNQIYNLGSGKKTTIKNLIEAIKKALNKDIPVIEEGITVGDILGCYANIEKVKNQLGYEPNFDIYDGVKDMASWVLNSSN
ncbi:MAG: hypothetical protein CMQ53_03095 [Gammaproteobacteria bacterium]|nr:hypothetical protein [Gammaproteobacteria bacterium]